MTNSQANRIRGVLAPVVTPFKSDLSIDNELFLSHCKNLLDDGVGLAMFGTNSEGTSIATAERLDALEYLLAGGLPPERMMPGTGHSSLAETVELTRVVLASGITSVLMLPPYFFKEADDEGLFSYFSEVIERLGSSSMRLYLYNIPQYTQVPLSPRLVGRLLDRYPNTIAGYKDSSGDWKNTKSLLDEYASRGLDVFSGSESFLRDAMPLGAAGCISATANVNAKGIASVYRAWQEGHGLAHAQDAANAVRKIFQSKPMIAAMKFFLAEKYSAPDWLRLRPPLNGLDPAVGSQLRTELIAIDFLRRRGAP